MVSIRVKQLAFLFLSFYLLVLLLVIKLSHIVFIASFFWSLVASSLLMSYISLRRTRISVELPSGLSQGEEGAIIHRVEEAWFLLPQLTSQVVLPPSFGRMSPALISPTERIGRERFFAWKRGVYKIKELKITALDFLGILKLSKRQRIEGEIVIYPSYAKLSFFPPFGGKEEEVLEGGQPARGGVEFASVREWQPGEDIKDIHWRLMAKWGRLFLVLHTQAGARTQTIVIDCFSKGVFGDWQDDTFELSLRIAASLSWAVISNGGEVTLLYAKGDGSIVRSPHSSFLSLLEELARLEANSPLALPSLLVNTPIEEDSSLVILTSLPDTALLPFLQRQKEKGNVPFLLLMDASSFGREGWSAGKFLQAVKGLAVVDIIRKGENLKERLEKVWRMPYST